jgi:predicted aldo/keto reductase-like oxidoreductase
VVVFVEEGPGRRFGDCAREGTAGKRGKGFLTSKISAGPDTGRDEIMRALGRQSAAPSNHHADVYFNHAVNEIAHLKNPEWYEFVYPKKQGKIRFAGMAGHAGHLTDCLDYAIDTASSTLSWAPTTSARTRVSSGQISRE